jgi:hypothetical protein
MNGVKRRQQLIAATFTLKKKDVKRRMALLRMCQKRLVKEPSLSYYLSIGTIPTTIAIFEE